YFFGDHRRWSELGQSEVENFCLAAPGYEDIRRLNIPVNDAFAMSGVEPLGDLDSQVHQTLHLQGPGFDQMLEGLAVHELHDDKVLPVFFTDIVNGVHGRPDPQASRSEEHTSELQSRFDLVCRLLLEKKKKTKNT